jgi:methylmalonyl-CoA/ethylmalonyl-CoA epimerase
MENKIDHIGYLTGDIATTAKAFEKLGYQMGEIVNDDTQRTRICFLTKANEVRVELVEPYEDNRTMRKMLTKQGVSPYHTCYEVDDVDREYEQLIQEDWVALFKPVAAPAFGNRKICYFWNAEIGFIELVNKQ